MPSAERAPDISVVVPTFRRPDLLPRLVAAMEAQTLPRDRFEVIVVDDGSGDESPTVLDELAAKTPVRLRPLLLEVNGGAAGARNVGWRSTTAPVVAFTDDDCVPTPGWLEAGLAAMQAAPEIGVAQGRTLRPDDAAIGDWTLWREIVAPSPYFEGCNLFFRRGALEAGGGFDEGLRFNAEDTAAGWSALEAGWQRGFVDDAVVHHDVDDRGVHWRARFSYRERRNLMSIAARFPAFRREAFWRPWAFQRDDALATLAVVGVVLGLRWRPALLLVLPYARERRPPKGHPRPVAVTVERVYVDVAQAAGVAVGAIRYRVFVV
jgi:glycosyltransferase involved in cell wall biosynthesis